MTNLPSKGKPPGSSRGRSSNAPSRVGNAKINTAGKKGPLGNATLYNSATQQKLRILIANEGVPQAGVRYTLDLGGKKVEGLTDKQGWFEYIFPRDPRLDTSKWKLILSGSNGDEEYQLLLNAVPPINTDAGVAARLKNLGFMDEDEAAALPPGADDEIAEAISLGLLKPGASDDGGILLKDAIAEFQAWYGLNVTGIADTATLKKLAEVHDR